MCCCWFHPSFRYKIDPQENNNPRVKHLHFGINCEGKNILQWKCWRWKMWEALVVGGVASSHWSATLSFYLWVIYICPPFSSATFHNKTIVCLIANQNMEDVRHTDVLMNVLFGDLHPYDPGCSCGVTLCIGSQTHRETEDPYRCQPFNLFCNQSSWNKAGCW